MFLNIIFSKQLKVNQNLNQTLKRNPTATFCRLVVVYLGPLTGFGQLQTTLALFMKPSSPVLTPSYFRVLSTPVVLMSRLCDFCCFLRQTWTCFTGWTAHRICRWAELQAWISKHSATAYGDCQIRHLTRKPNMLNRFDYKMPYANVSGELK